MIVCTWHNPTFLFNIGILVAELIIRFIIGAFVSTSSITALTRERELVSQSQFFFPSCFSQPNGHSLAAPSSMERQIGTEICALFLL